MPNDDRVGRSFHTVEQPLGLRAPIRWLEAGAVEGAFMLVAAGGESAATWAIAAAPVLGANGPLGIGVAPLLAPWMPTSSKVSPVEGAIRVERPAIRDAPS